MNPREVGCAGAARYGELAWADGLADNTERALVGGNIVILDRFAGSCSTCRAVGTLVSGEIQARLS